MIGPHEIEKWFTALEQVLPEQVMEPGWNAPCRRSAVLGTIRADLMPFIIGGPTFERSVDDNVLMALQMFKMERGGECLSWLRRAVIAAQQVNERNASFEAGIAA